MTCQLPRVCFRPAALPIHRRSQGFRHSAAYNRDSPCVQATRNICWAELARSRTPFGSHQYSMKEVCTMLKLRFLLLFTGLLIGSMLSHAQSKPSVSITALSDTWDGASWSAGSEAKRR